MNKSEFAKKFYRRIEEIHFQDYDEAQKIGALYQILNQLLFELTQDESLALPSRTARISYIVQKHELKKSLQWHIFNARNIFNQSLSNNNTISIGKHKELLKTISFLTSAVTKTPLTPSILDIIDQNTIDAIAPQNQKKSFDKLKVWIFGALPDENLLIGKICDSTLDPIHIRVMDASDTDIYAESIQSILKLFSNILVNLLEVIVEPIGIYRAKKIILEPDYLFDISSISECFSDPVTPRSYLLKKFMPVEPTKSIMLGNIANFFLDELMQDINISFEQCFRQVFTLNPLVFLNYSDDELLEMKENAKNHFIHLKHIINYELSHQGILKDHCYLEPSFYSERFGIQGRLDLWYKNKENDRSAIIELKSGKLYRPNQYGLNQTHYVQTLLYDLLVKSVYGKDMDPMTFILYSNEAKNTLKYAPVTKKQQDEALNMRNKMLCIEKLLMTLDKDLDKKNIVDQIINSELNQAVGFMRTMFRDFSRVLKDVSQLERAYFMAFIAFIAREQYLAKVGDHSFGGTHHGLASLWLQTQDEKSKQYEMLSNLTLSGHYNDKSTILKFTKTSESHPLAHFRLGDIVVCYKETNKAQNVLSDQIFKGVIISMRKVQIEIELRAKQFNSKLFDDKITWTIEKDMMDHGFRHQYLSLFKFLNASKYYRSLILSQEAPKSINQPFKASEALNHSQNQVLQKAIDAEDYFLILGPPGTGKTKMMLSSLVKHYTENDPKNILLLSYTKRALNEICDAIHDFAKDNYVRIGNQSSTDSLYSSHLLNQLSNQYTSRKTLSAELKRRKIFVSTVSTLLGRTELFKIKHFDLVIIDEASQILEPYLIGLLSRFKKFIMIGDHKQLPAVVLQEKAKTEVHHEALNMIGLIDRRNSLFERLFHQATKNKWYNAYGMLNEQGRMHAIINEFPSIQFYENQLKCINSDEKSNHWQFSNLKLEHDTENSLQYQLSHQRVIFFDRPSKISLFNKINHTEANMVVDIIMELKTLYVLNKKKWHENSVGIICPYRAQIALIRQCLDNQNIEQQDITIDTVERFQGGARDIILISLCTNSVEQLDTMMALSDDGKIDRKLNVALTRARQQLILIGNRKVLVQNKIYSDLISWIDQLYK